MARPYTILKTALSLDGCIDDCGPKRLILSSEGDLQAVKRLRAEVDAVLVGANTIRKDDPALSDTIKVTLTRSGKISKDKKFFQANNKQILVYTTAAAARALQSELPNCLCVAAGEGDVDLNVLLEDLGARGIKRLMIEGGSEVIQQFLEADLVDEARLAISSRVIGDPEAPRFLPKQSKGLENLPLELESARLENEMLVVHLRRKTSATEAAARSAS